MRLVQQAWTWTEVIFVRKQIGDVVTHPETGEQGEVQEILTNPACLLRTLVISWQSGEMEEMDELEFGPLED